jgi:transcriptional regulator with XRE-family HTH domain
MASRETPFDAGTRCADRWRREIGEEFRHARVRLGLSQREVAAAARVDRADYSRIERGKLARLSIETACRIGAVLGLDVSVRAYPGGRSIRDGGQAPRLQKFLECIGDPLRFRLEMPLPARGDRPEQRAWDVMLFGHNERTAVEFEARLLRHSGAGTHEWIGDRNRRLASGLGNIRKTPEDSKPWRSMSL